MTVEDSLRVCPVFFFTNIAKHIAVSQGTPSTDDALAATRRATITESGYLCCGQLFDVDDLRTRKAES